MSNTNEGADTLYRATAPNGKPIVGTLEVVHGRAEIQDGSFFRNEDGTLDFEWGGYTEVFWDDQKTVTQDGKRVFMDTEGNEWTEDQVQLVPVADEEKVQ